MPRKIDSAPTANRQKGFSLIEVLVATAVLVVIILGVAAVFTNQQRVAKIESERLESRQEARAVMDTMIAQTRRAGMGIMSSYEEAKTSITTVAAANRLSAIGRANIKSVGTWTTVSGGEPTGSQIVFRGELEGDGQILQYIYKWDGDKLDRERWVWNSGTNNFGSKTTTTMIEEGVRDFALLVDVNGALCTWDISNVYELSNGSYSASAVTTGEFWAAIGSAQTFRLRVSIQRGPNAVLRRALIQTLESNIYLRNGSTTYSALATEQPPWSSQNG